LKRITILCSSLVLLLTVLSGCGVPTAKQPSDKENATKTGDKEMVINVAGSGGKIEQAIRDGVAKKFTEKTGIKVNYTPGVSSENLSKVEIQKNSPEIDVAIIVPTDVQRAVNKGLVEKEDQKSIPNMSKLDSRYVAVDNMGIPIMGYVIVPAYNSQAFDKEGISPIRSWNDIISEKYKGRTSYADIVNDWGYTMLYSLALANGGSLDNMEPGLNKAKDLAAYSETFYKNSSQMTPPLQQGSAMVTVIGSYNVAQLAEAGLPFKMVIPKEGAPLQAMNAMVVKNAPHKKAAEQFVDFLLNDDSQKVVADNAFYPVTKGVPLPSKYDSIIGFKDSDNLFRPDVPKLAELREKWTDRWVKEVTPQLGTKVKN
jgi:putative spermidine/putrescine transport system substrate-binding protein